MSDRYSLNRRDKKLAGVCSTIGDVFNIDPTFIRIGFVAAAMFISWKLALVAYIGAGHLLPHPEEEGAPRCRPPVGLRAHGRHRPRPHLGP